MLTVSTAILKILMQIYVFTYMFYLHCICIFTLHLYYIVHKEDLLSLRKAQVLLPNVNLYLLLRFCSYVDIKTLNAKYRLTTDAALMLWLVIT